MKRRTANNSRVRMKVRAAAVQLRGGALTLSEVLQLSVEEMEALATVAHGLRRRGRLQQALAVFGMLVTIDPLNSRWWGAMASLHLSGGEHGLAVVCFEALALLQGRTPAHTRQEVAALRQLGAQDLAQHLVRLSEAPGETRERRP